MLWSGLVFIVFEIYVRGMIFLCFNFWVEFRVNEGVEKVSSSWEGSMYLKEKFFWLGI